MPVAGEALLAAALHLEQPHVGAVVRDLRGDTGAVGRDHRRVDIAGRERERLDAAVAADPGQQELAGRGTRAYPVGEVALPGDSVVGRSRYQGGAYALDDRHRSAAQLQAVDVEGLCQEVGVERVQDRRWPVAA